MITFTLEQANRALSLIRPILSDVLLNMELATQLHNEIKIDRAQLTIDEEALLEKINVAQKYLEKIEYNISELEDVGVFVKDLTLGIIDFPSMDNNEEISFCWKYGEESVKYQHGRNQGFAGRRPVGKSEHLIA